MAISMLSEGALMSVEVLPLLLLDISWKLKVLVVVHYKVNRNLTKYRLSAEVC